MKAALKTALILAVLTAAVSCVQPSSTETFIRSSERGPDRAYRFSIDMSDSTLTYDLRLYTRIDCTPAQFDALPDPELVMRYIAPSGLETNETFTILKDDFSRREYFTADYDMPCRTDFRPREHGIWQLCVTVSNEARIPGLLGLGLQVRRRDK